MTSLLELKAVKRYFGGVKSLDGVNMKVPKGEITGLIGPNGAGKTTLINCVSGLDHPTDGNIIFNGENIENAAPHKINIYGMARTYQNIRLFNEMTVQENVIVAQHSAGNSTLLHSLFQLPSYRRERELHRENAFELLKQFNLDHLENTKAGNLPYGDQRRLELARAIATKPTLILLDEPTAGMNPTETAALGEQILWMKTQGITVMVVEHDMSLIAQVCDMVYVLNFGKIIAHDTIYNIRRDQTVIEAYLGSEGVTHE